MMMKKPEMSIRLLTFEDSDAHLALFHGFDGFREALKTDGNLFCRDV